MASKPLRFDLQAEQEFLSALAWYQARSFEAASNFESAFYQAIQRIEKTPQRWPVYFGDFRRYILRQFPFSVVYREFPSEILVFAIAHGSRRPGYWRERVNP
jgi:plasmid stabilization system protein ParE